jgi:hypothetical protein
LALRTPSELMVAAVVGLREKTALTAADEPSLYEAVAV